MLTVDCDLKIAKDDIGSFPNYLSRWLAGKQTADWRTVVGWTVREIENKAKLNPV